jgi:HEAT repeat protein
MLYSDTSKTLKGKELMQMRNIKKLGGSAIAELADKGDTKTLIEIVEQNADKTDVKLAILELGELKCHEAVEPIIHSLLSLDTIRSAAVQSLGNIADSKAVKPLVILLQNSEQDSLLYGEILEALGKIDDTMAEKVIIDAFCNGPAEVTKIAAIVLKKMGAKATKLLLSALDNVSLKVKQTIVKTLGEIGDKMAVQTLMTILQNPEEVPAIREEVAIVLAKIKEGVDIEFILQFVKKPISTDDKNYSLRCCLITALGEIGNFKATEMLTRLLLNKNNELRIRYCAAHALGRMGDNSAIDSLVSVLKDPQDIDIKSAVAAALLALDSTKTALPLITYLKSKTDFMSEYKLMSPDNL